MKRRSWKQAAKATRARIELKPHEISPVPIVGDGGIATSGLLADT